MRVECVVRVIVEEAEEIRAAEAEAVMGGRVTFHAIVTVSSSTIVDDRGGYTQVVQLRRVAGEPGLVDRDARDLVVVHVGRLGIEQHAEGGLFGELILGGGEDHAEVGLGEVLHLTGVEMLGQLANSMVEPGQSARPELLLYQWSSMAIHDCRWGWKGGSCVTFSMRWLWRLVQWEATKVSRPN